MPFSFRLIFFCFAANFFLAGCYFTIQSSQYELVKRLLKSNKTSGPAQNNWNLSWAGYEFLLTAVNVGSQVWFINKQEQLVRFDGWQITQSSNILPASNIVNIDLSNKIMVFSDDNSELGKYDCEIWSEVISASSTSLSYSQICQTTRVEFENTIELNEKGEIVKLRFVIHPDYPHIELRKISI